MPCQIEIIGHRGWPAGFPENTLAGFLAAATVADGVELDVRRTADGKLVLAHDPVLAGHSVPDTTWAELGELDLGEGHHPALLDEVMAAIPETPIQLEVKNLPFEPGYEPDHRLALETAERARPGDVLTGFNPEMLAVVRKTFPDLTTGLAVPYPADLDEAVKLCVKAGHRLLIPDHSLIVDELNVDLDVYPWTVNDEHRASELVELGVRGIITDDPGLMAARFRSDR